MHKGVRRRRIRKDDSEINPVVKYLLFGFNVIFWLVGFAILGVGVYAWIEKETFTRLSSLSIGVLFDPAFIFLVVGALIFIIGFCGCIGALRENTVLLCMFSCAVGMILLVEITIGVLVYLYKEKVNEEIKKNLVTMIEAYRDDEDLQDFIDWIQRDWLKCCGITNPDDWNKNIYFVCKDVDSWIESCGVPPSCCIPEYSSNGQCGFGVRRKPGQNYTKIYEDGCLKKGEAWLKYHILPVSISIGVLGLLQLLGVCFAQSLRSDILLQKSKWYRSHR